MKNLLGLIGSSCAIAFCPIVQAETNVTEIEKKTTTQRAITFYGAVDVGITLVNNEAGKRNTKLDTGIMEPNYWGIKGTEDLGGGRKAIFQLESGFNLNDGKLASTGTLFDRIAIVGLASEFGKITVGTQFDLINDYVTPFNVSAAASGHAAHQGNFDRIAGNSVQRSIKITSPDFNGLTFGGLYSFADKNQPSKRDEVAGGSGNILNVGAHYNSGPFAVGASYMRPNSPRGEEPISPYPSHKVLMQYCEDSRGVCCTKQYHNTIRSPCFGCLSHDGEIRRFNFVRNDLLSKMGHAYPLSTIFSK